MIIESIVNSVDSVKKVKKWELVENDIKVVFKKELYFYDEEKINYKIRKYKKVVEIQKDYKSVILRDMV
jgi:hypothetical protein